MTAMGSTAPGAVQIAPVSYIFSLEGESVPAWRVAKLTLKEGISELYACDLELMTPDAAADTDALYGAACTLQIGRPTALGKLARKLSGIVTMVEWRGVLNEATIVKVRVEPALAALGKCSNSRIFSELSISDILQDVLTAGLTPYQRAVRLELDRTYEKREYTVQYSETDLDFVMRLMAEEGIFFYFDHEGTAEELVLTDANAKCLAYESVDGKPIPIVNAGAPQDLMPTETLKELFAAKHLCSTGVVLRDFDWTQPRLDLSRDKADTAARGRNLFEYPEPQVLSVYDVGKKIYTNEEGMLHAQLRLEEVAAGVQQLAGASNVSGLSAGQVIEVSTNVIGPLGTEYLVTHVEHEGESPEVLSGHTTTDVAHKSRYQNTFTCIPLEVPYRPRRRPRRVMPGPETAKVVNEGGSEEVFTDEHGRVKVLFHWARPAGSDDKQLSCFLRVVQPWAGAGFGVVFLPRVGMEVMVQFLDGNPDRPIITGCVYNGENAHPYLLPDDKTKSVIKTSSSPGNKGSNELRFEDAADKEEVYLHAQKDLNEVVKNNHTLSVTANQTVTVTKNRTKTIKENETNKVEGERATTVTKKETETFDDTRTITVKKDDTLTVTEGGRTVDVKSKLKETYRGDRETTIDSKDKLEVNAGSGSAKKETIVHGEYEITADKHFKLVQGNDQLMVCDAVTLTSAGDITLQNEGTTIKGEKSGKLSLSATKEVSIVCGSASITLKSDGKIEITGMNVTAGSANNNIKFEPAGTTVSGVKVTSTAVGIHEIQGALIKIG